MKNWSRRCLTRLPRREKIPSGDAPASSRSPGAHGSTRCLQLSRGSVRLDPEVTHDDISLDRSNARAGVGDFPLRALEPEGGPLNTATARSIATSSARVALENACLCARVAADNKARDVLVLDMRGQTPLYDFFVIATGTSRRQIHTLAEEIDAALHAQGEKRLSIEGYEGSKWVVQDYGDIVVHIFSPEARQYYRLEELWDDAERIDWERF